MRGSLRFGLSCIVLSGCSIVNRVDVCDTAAPGDVQVNVLADRDQYTSSGRSAVRLPTGQIAVVWNSDNARTSGNQTMVAPNAGSVRAGLREPDGRFVSACTSGAAGEVAVSADPAVESTGHPAIATGTTAGSPVYVVWKQGPLGLATRVYARALSSRLCPLCASSTPTILQVSDDADTMGDERNGAVVPVVAATPDGSRALVAYLVHTPLTIGFSLRLRPISVSMATDLCGRLEMNPIDGRDGPGTLVVASNIGAPRLLSYAEGFVLVWPAFAGNRWVARWRFMDRLGVHPMDAPGVPAAPQETELGGVAMSSQVPSLALALDGADLVLAWDRVHANPPLQREVVFQRYSPALQPRGAEVVASPPGDHDTPQVAVLPESAVMLSWDDDTRGAQSADILARVFDRSGSPMFTTGVCQRDAFRLSAMGEGRRVGSTLVRADDRVFAVYGDSSGAAPDTFGYAVRGRSFVLSSLAPGLR